MVSQSGQFVTGDINDRNRSEMEFDPEGTERLKTVAQTNEFTLSVSIIKEAFSTVVHNERTESVMVRMI